MEETAIEKRLIACGRVHERIQAPAIVDEARLEQQARIGVLSGCRILFREVKPALLQRATWIGPEDGFEGERFRSRQRMFVNE